MTLAVTTTRACVIAAALPVILIATTLPILFMDVQMVSFALTMVDASHKMQTLYMLLAHVKTSNFLEHS